MALINLRSSEEAITKYWRILHTINLALIPLVFCVWLFVPSFTKNLKSTPQLVLRILSVGFSISGSSIILFCSNELTKLKPKIDSLEKRDNAEFKHSIASVLLDAQRTNELIVETVFNQRRAELDPYAFMPQSLPDEEFRGSVQSSELANDDSSLVPNSSEPTEIQLRNEPYFDAVFECLEDEIADSKIIKDIMGFRNVRYQEGKAILSKIKAIYESEVN